VKRPARIASAAFFCPTIAPFLVSTFSADQKARLAARFAQKPLKWFGKCSKGFKIIDSSQDRRADPGLFPQPAMARKA
jgi:hypothetical protein